MNEILDALRFLRPQLLWGLLPWALFIYWRMSRPAVSRSAEPAAHSPWARVIDTHLLHALLAQPALASRTAERHRPARRLGAAVAPALVGAFLLLALAGPQVARPGGNAAPPWRPDAARVLLIDLSPAFDALPERDRSRLRNNLRRFVHALPAGETALVAVAGDAWLVVPPSEDAAALDPFLAELGADAVPVPGDRPDLGLALARQTLAATHSRQADIYWLRVAPRRPVEGSAGPTSGVAPNFLQLDGRVEDWLAAATAGARSPAWTASVLNLGLRADAGWIDLGPWLIVLALPFAALAAIRAGAVLSVVLCLGVVSGLAAPPAAAADAAFDRGVALYRAGRHADAAAAFARAAADDPRAHYNRGNALARAGLLPAALAAYDESLRLRPRDASTLHNREIVARLLRPPPALPPPPPPPPTSLPPSPSAVQAAEAARAIEQWLRRPPSTGDGLLKRKLALEEARRQARRER
jgi:Ca-activated chloride channel family protein